MLFRSKRADGASILPFFNRLLGLNVALTPNWLAPIVMPLTIIGRAIVTTETIESAITLQPSSIRGTDRTGTTYPSRYNEH